MIPGAIKMSAHSPLVFSPQKHALKHFIGKQSALKGKRKKLMGNFFKWLERKMKDSKYHKNATLKRYVTTLLQNFYILVN